MANSATTLVGIDDLNYFMKDLRSGIVVDSDFIWHSAWDAFKSRVDTKREFQGNNFKMLIRTDYDLSAEAFGERSTFPYAGDTAYVEMNLPLKQVVVPAGITQAALDRATGGEASWGKVVVDEVKRATDRAFPWFMENCIMGDGTGYLARVVSAAEGTDTVVVTCDNTYIDGFWENVRMIKKGMWVSFIGTDGELVTDNSVTSWKVSAVSFGDRANSTATTGTFTITTASGRDDEITTLLNVNGVTVYRTNTLTRMSETPDDVGGNNRYQSANRVATTGTYSDPTTSLPMGLAGIYQTTDSSYDYSDGTIDLTLDTFQGLARSSYDTLNAHFFNGTNITGGSGTAGTPGDWNSSTFSDAWWHVFDASGREPDLILMSGPLAMAWDRINEGGITFTLDANSDWPSKFRGATFASHVFKAPNGNLVPIVVTKSVSDNVAYMITTDDLLWLNKGGFNWKSWEHGGMWRLSMGNRYDAYEAMFMGYSQLAAERCDGGCVIQDLSTAVA